MRRTKVGHRQGKLSGFGAKQRAGKPHDVAQVQALEQGEGLRSQHLFLDVGLDAAGAVLEVAKGGLAELPQEHEAAGQAEGLVQGLQFVGGQGPELPQDLGDGVGGNKAVGIGLDALFPELCELLQALITNIVRLCHGVSA